jgi:hypothetical protein
MEADLAVAVPVQSSELVDRAARWTGTPHIATLVQAEAVLEGKAAPSQARRPARCQILEPAAVDYIRVEIVMAVAVGAPETSALEAVAVLDLA